VTNRWTPLSAALLLALGGCNLGPDFIKPLFEAPPAYKAPAEAPAAVPSAQPASWPEADWWRNFRAPALDAYMEAARKNNYDLAAAAARIVQADARARIAGAALLPTLDGTADASRSRSGTAGSTTSSSRSRQASNRYSAGLLASYELDFWGRNRAGLESAEAASLASRYDSETVALTVMSDVATTYFQILEFQDRYAIARENLANAERVMAVVDARAQSGATSALEVAQQRTVVAQQRAALPPLEQGLRQSENALAVLLGQTPESVVVRTGTLDNVAAPAVAAGLPSELLMRRPDIQNAEAQLLGANADIKAARAAFFPTIALTGQYGYQSAVLSSMFTGPGLFYSIAAGLTAPIFSGGQLEGQLELNKARYEELVQTYRKAVISAFTDVENSLTITQQTAEQQRLQEDAVEQARIAFELADARYRAGAVDLLTVLDSQRTLFSARDQLAQVKSARLQGVVSLYRALGGGWRVEPTPPAP
jgi:NodT family efflux transporter outer membrane factor (OMF) lipoprotein